MRHSCPHSLADDLSRLIAAHCSIAATKRKGAARQVAEDRQMAEVRPRSLARAQAMLRGKAVSC